MLYEVPKMNLLFIKIRIAFVNHVETYQHQTEYDQPFGLIDKTTGVQRNRKETYHFSFQQVHKKVLFRLLYYGLS